MQRPGVPSLDQLTVFLAVVEMGSFAAAGRRLGRATSAVSYAITIWNSSSACSCSIVIRRGARD